MRMALAVLALALALPGSANASNSMTMICENPRQEYVVRFSKAMNSLSAGETQYRVLAVEETKDRMVIVGLTINDGPTLRAHFRPYKKMEFFTDNQLFQTDGCR